ERAILCLASFEKGAEFMREAKRQGWRVLLLTVPSLEHADWPRESVDEIFYMPDLYDEGAVIRGVSYLARSQPIDRIAALDDFDVEMGAALREHLAIPGLGATIARRFRDKLMMRTVAAAAGI